MHTGSAGAWGLGCSLWCRSMTALCEPVWGSDSPCVHQDALRLWIARGFSGCCESRCQQGQCAGLCGHVSSSPGSMPWLEPPGLLPRGTASPFSRVAELFTSRQQHEAFRLPFPSAGCSASEPTACWG